MSYIWALLILWVGILLGFAIRTWMTHRFTEYGGTIVIDQDSLRETTVYSLVLDDYPEKLEFKKEVVFKVDSHKKHRV